MWHPFSENESGKLHCARRRISFWSTEEALICIDDFRVEDDAGYCFDRYLKGTLEWGYLQVPDGAEMDVYFPVARSNEETGSRRGTIYLAVGDNVRRSVVGFGAKFLRPAEVVARGQGG